MRVRAAHAPRLAPAGATDGSDGRGRRGWLRQPPRAPSGAMHTALAATRRLSPSHVRARSPPCSVPLLACPERQPRDRLAPVAQAQGGGGMAWEGLAPHGGAPPMGGIRARATGLPRRRGWLAPQARPL